MSRPPRPRLPRVTLEHLTFLHTGVKVVCRLGYSWIEVDKAIPTQNRTSTGTMARPLFHDSAFLHTSEYPKGLFAPFLDESKSDKIIVTQMGRNLCVNRFVQAASCSFLHTRWRSPLRDPCADGHSGCSPNPAFC